MAKYQNKYRIESARLRDWDYGWNGSYFLTICTRNRQYFFGDVIHGEMKLSAIGELANKHMIEIPDPYGYAKLDEFIVMPNHVHVILVIDKPADGNCGVVADGICRDVINRASTNTAVRQGGVTGDKNPMLHDNISHLINWYKGRVTFESHKIDLDFGWQDRFYDHIIRNESEYQRIRNYIKDNPLKWHAGKER